jgi:cystathionine beta-lyase/cystathionine gamma-synthase
LCYVDAMDEWKRAFETRAIHSGKSRSADFRSTAPAIYPATTFVYDDVARMHAALAPDGEGFAYSRNANPTVRELEQVIASLEESEEALAFGSGMAAIHAAILSSGLLPGQSVLAAEQLYGGSRSLLQSVLSGLGFPLILVDTSDLDLVDARLKAEDIGILLFEPVSNPLMTVANVGALIELAHRHRAAAIVDNTFLSPYLLRPSTLGADFVVESATKYLGGHGDVMAGIVACSQERSTAVRSFRTATGGILGPFDAWLVLRGLKTLAVRVTRQCTSAQTLAEFFVDARVGVVHYPGLPADPGYDLAMSQFTGGLAGGMLSFDTDLDIASVDRFLNALELAVSGPSLGDVGTLVLHPMQTSHRALTRNERAQLGIGDGLIRVSVGLEDPDDLARDFAAAFEAVYS